MELPIRRPTHTRMAILLSIGLHLCVFVLLVSLRRGESTATSIRIERFSPYHVTSLTRRAARSQSLRPLATVVPPRHQVVAPRSPNVPRRARPTNLQRRAQPANRRPELVAGRVARVATTSRKPPTQTMAVVQSASTRRASDSPVAPARAPVALPQLPTAAPTLVPSPAATDSPAIAATTFRGLFSQNYPPALPSPAVAQIIRERLAGHGRIRIDVDDAGHATAITFEPADRDESAVQELRARLLAITYVPADCNGLHCAGTLAITY